MKKSDELRQSIAQLGDKLELLNAKVTSEDREMTAVEQTNWDAGLATLEGLQTQLTSEVSREAGVSKLRAARANQYQPQGSIPTTPVSLPNVKAPRLEAFSGEGNRDQAARDAYDCGLWLKATLLNDPDSKQQLSHRRGEWLATMTEGIPSAGGYAVPAPMANAIIESREAVGATRKLARIFPMTSDTLAVPKFDTGTTVYYPGEAGAITPSDATLASITLTTKKRAILTFISSELRDDAIVSITDLLTRDMGHQLALKEDQESILGDGTATFGSETGLLASLGSAGVFTAGTGDDTWAELDLTDFFGTMSKIPDAYRDHAQMKWLCSAPFKWQVMDRLALAQGGSPMVDVSSGATRMLFLGYEVVLSDRMPTTTAASTVSCLFGNFPRAMALGDRTGVRVAVSDEFAFDTDRVAIRATVRYDINVHEGGDVTDAGAYAGLSTAI